MAKDKPIEIWVSGSGEAYARQAIRQVGSNEVGGVFRIERGEDYIYCDNFEVLPQTVNGGSCDFEESVDNWLRSWNKPEDVDHEDPCIDFGLWHTHPITGWSAQDDEWISNYVTRGLLVSLVYNSQKRWESRVDTLVNKMQFTRIGDLSIDHPGYAEFIKKATADVKEHVTIVKAKVHIHKGSRGHTDHRNYKHWGSPMEIFGRMGFGGSFEDDDSKKGTPRLAEPPAMSTLHATPTNEADKRSAYNRFVNAKTASVYFGAGTSSATLRDGEVFLATLNLSKGAPNVKLSRDVLRAAGISAALIKSHLNSGTLLYVNPAGFWATRSLSTTVLV